MSRLVVSCHVETKQTIIMSSEESEVMSVKGSLDRLQWWQTEPWIQTQAGFTLRANTCHNEIMFSRQKLKQTFVD